MPRAAINNYTMLLMAPFMLGQVTGLTSIKRPMFNVVISNVPGFKKPLYLNGAELDALDAKLKTLKLTRRNAPADQPKSVGPCLFTGKPGVEEVLISRAY